MQLTADLLGFGDTEGAHVARRERAREDVGDLVVRARATDLGVLERTQRSGGRRRCEVVRCELRAHERRGEQCCGGDECGGEAHDEEGLVGRVVGGVTSVERAIVELEESVSKECGRPKLETWMETRERGRPEAQVNAEPTLWTGGRHY